MAAKDKKDIYIPKNDLDPREVALCILLSVTEGRRKSNLAISESLRTSKLSERDRALVTAIAEGTLDYLIRIDYIISRYTRKPLRFMQPEARGILRMSVYQILFLDRVPDSAACNEAVELAKKRGISGLSGFINAVLRSVVRDKEKGSGKLFDYPEKHIYYSLPKWLYKKLCADYGTQKAEAIAASYLTKRGVTVRFNLSLSSEEEIRESLSEDGAEPEKVDMRRIFEEKGVELSDRYLPVVYKLKNASRLNSLRAFKEGLVCVQDPASTLPAALSEPKEGDFIIDVCAAPGGKSMQLCDLLKGSGMVAARDVSHQKIRLIEENVSRTGFKNISLKVWDALKEDEESFFRADIVMADLPCSGLGIIGRKPDIKQNIKSYSIEELRELQREMLMVVSRYVKPHGRLVYSTCTITPEENEQNVAWALSHLGFKLERSIKLLPDEEHDGFFAAVLRKEFI